ncbi:MAG TPA: HAD family hydrolase [Kofleriaceae bacterium]|nr:HAD family hydrolase [Kofleriaceae bacterium]
MVRAIFFDLDDTLFDRTAALRLWTVAQVGAVDAAAFDAVVELDQRGRRSRLLFAAGMVEQFGVQRTVTELANAFPSELAAHVAPEPGVRATVQRLAALYHVAIVTNGGAAQREKLARAGLADLAGAVFVSGELGIAKPASGIFEHAVAWSGAAASECVFVGDDPINDLAPAAALGMTTAWLPRAPWPAAVAMSPTYTIASIGALAHRLVPPIFEVARIARLERRA